MSNYSDNPNSCRVDFFKPSGKWYTTEAVEFKDKYYSKEHLIHNAFRAALEARERPDSYKGMTAVCLHPYHELEHPITLVV